MNVKLAYASNEGYVIYTKMVMPILIICQSYMVRVSNIL